MLNSSQGLTRRAFARIPFAFLSLLALLLTAHPSFAADLIVEFSVVARSDVTSIPGGVGKFVDFAGYPAIDEDGNVVFTGVGGQDNNGESQVGIYTAIGNCCQRVADKNTLVPGGGGATFDSFAGLERNDIGGGRVAFRADISSSSTLVGVYSNVGQASASDLVEVAVIDGSEWSYGGEPWVDGDVVAMWGRRLVPEERNTTLLWVGSDLSKAYIEASAGYAMAYNTHASVSDAAAIFRQTNANSDEMGIMSGGDFEALAVRGVTPMPGREGVTFNKFLKNPVVDRGGLDALFGATGTGTTGLYKRTNGGALYRLADNSMLMPGAPAGREFGYFPKESASLANGQAVFVGQDDWLLEGLYTDLGGELSVLVDNELNATIDLGGQLVNVDGIQAGPKAFAHTGQGYETVFRVNLQSGGSAIIKATITEGLPDPDPDTFLVYKNFSDNNSSSVSVSLSCTSGTVTNSPQWAREGVPAVFNISGASAGATCTATEPVVPSGYSEDESDCQDGDPLNGSCTIVNTYVPSLDSFRVYKNFSDNNSSSVSVSLSCTSGTVTNNPQSASEGSPAEFTIEDAAPGASCTAVENSVPTGYSEDESDCQDGDPLNGSCTIVNTYVPSLDSFRVYKNFSDNNSSSVSVSLSCTSGTVTNNPQSASEGSPAEFTIEDAAPGASCTAVENSVPTGYSEDESDCQDGDPLNGSCTIVNTYVPSLDSFRVYKNFSDNNSSSVSVSLSCTSGTVTNNPQSASEGSPAEFTIEDAAPGAICTAVENSVPSGYSEDESDCQDGDPLNGSCTIVNTFDPLTDEQVLIYEGFEDSNADGWSTSGSVWVSNQVAIGQNALRHGGGSSSMLSVSTVGYTHVSVEMKLAATSLEGSDACIAEVSTNGGESWITVTSVADGNDTSTFYSGTLTPAGASGNANLQVRFRSTGSHNSDLCFGDEVSILGAPDDGGSGSFTVHKNFSDNNSDWVTVALSCSSGTVTNSPQSAREGTAAVFTIEDASPGATCTATEISVASGYTKDESDCESRALNESCMLVNTLDQPSTDLFTVFKDFDDDNVSSVSISLSCSSGTVLTDTLWASESSPAVFTIEGAEAGATCTAVENAVPEEYDSNNSDCQDGDPINGFCTIINQLASQPPPGEEEMIVNSGFEDGSMENWTSIGNVVVDGILAIGQYSLRHTKVSTSDFSISTVGYREVRVKMHLAAASLKKNEACYAEVSTNGGDSWSPVVVLRKGDDNGSFVSGLVSPATAEDNPDLRLRFRAKGRSKGGYCYGDEVIVMGKPE